MSVAKSASFSVSEPAFRVTGAAGLGLALIAGRFVQAMAFFVLARFLDAPQMGVVAILAVLFLAFFQMTNLGFDRYIVYAKSDRAETLDAAIDTVWTLQLLRGGIILLAVVPVAMGLDRFTDLNIGYFYIAGIAGVVILTSLVHPGLSVFERGGNFSRIAYVRAASASAGGVITILLVLIWPFPWVYIAGQAVNALVLVSISFQLSSRRLHVTLDPERLKEVFSFGKHMIVIASVSFLSAQAQHGYVAVLFGSAILGAYYTWERLVSLPRELTTQILDRVFFAMASDYARRNIAVGPAHLTGFVLTMVVMVPFNLFVWFHGDRLMRFLAGDTWDAFFWVGQFFVLISFCYSVAGTIGPFMLVFHPKITSTLRSIEAAAVIALMTVLGPKFGVTGVLTAILAVIGLAVLLRIIVLYRYIIHSDRLRHAASMVAILGGLGGPIILWEQLVQTRLPENVQLPGALAFYAIFLTSAATWTFSRRQVLLQQLK